MYKAEYNVENYQILMDFEVFFVPLNQPINIIFQKLKFYFFKKNHIINWRRSFILPGCCFNGTCMSHCWGYWLNIIRHCQTFFLCRHRWYCCCCWSWWFRCWSRSFIRNIICTSWCTCWRSFWWGWTCHFIFDCCWC